MIKRVTILLTIAFVLNCFTVFAQAKEISGYEKSVYVLDCLKIIESDGLQLSETTTRGEFTKAIINAYGLSQAAQANKVTSFTDVSEEYAGFIQLAKSLGFVKGITENEFMPNAGITYAQASKVLVAMLGYHLQAEQGGGYPSGYVAIATSKGLFKGVNIGGLSEFVTNKDMTLMLYNALEVKLFEQTDFGSDVNYSQTENTILNSKLKVDRFEAKITANSQTSIDTNMEITQKESVYLTRTGALAVSYFVGETDIEDYLGYDVTVYSYFDDAKQADIILGYFIDKNQDSIEINSRDITKVTSTQIEYMVRKNNDETIKKINTALGLRLVYNGRVVIAEQYDLELLKANYGKIIFLSSKNTNVYDIALISSVQNAIVSEINIEDNKLYLSKNKHSLSTIDIDDFDAVTFYEDSKKIDIKDIKKDSVAAVLMSLDKKIVRIYFSDKKVSGTVTETYTDEVDYVVINDEKYEVSYDIKSEIKVSDTSEFYINSFGLITYVGEISERVFKYAYVIDVEIATSIDKSASIKVLDESGKILTLTLNDKVKLNGEMLTDQIVLNAVGQYKLIQYKLDSEKLVKELNTALDYTNDNDYIGYNEYDFSKDNFSNSMYYKATSIPTLGGSYLVPSDTIVFNIPSDKTDTDNYMISDTSIFLSDVYYIVAVYDADKKKHTEAIVNYGIDTNESSEETLPWNTSVFVVDKNKSVFTNDEVNVIVEGYQGGKVAQIKPAQTNNTQFPELGDVVLEKPDKKDSMQFTELKQGDIIQYKLNAKGEVDMFRLLYRKNDALDIKIWNGNRYSVNLLTAVAMVSYVDENTLRITTDDNSNNSLVSNRVFPISTVNIYIYDTVLSRITTGTINDILSMDNAGYGASKIFLRSYRDTLGDIVIIK